MGHLKKDSSKLIMKLAELEEDQENLSDRVLRAHLDGIRRAVESLARRIEHYSGSIGADTKFSTV